MYLIYNSMKIKIYNPITEKESKIEEYGRTAKKIYKYMIEEQGAEPDTILPNDLSYVNGRLVKVKTIVDDDNVRRITYNKVKSAVGKGADTMSYFKKVFAAYKGQTIKVVKRYSVMDLNYGEFMDSDDIQDIKINSIEPTEDAEIVDIPVKGFSKWWKKWSFFLWIDSIGQVFGIENEVLNDDPKLQAQLLIMTLDKVNAENYNQFFLDGITNCFFTPIKDWALDCEAGSKSKSAQKRYKTINKKVDKYIEKYSKGIPEEDMPAVCNDLQISVEIDLPSTMLNKNKYIEVESQKKALKKFRYINTRLNHIELNNVNSKDNYDEVNKEKINKIFKESNENGDFILWKECKDGITQINTLDKIYKLKDEGGYGEAVKAFEEKFNFSEYKIEKNKNQDLTEFLDISLNTNQSITFAPKCKTIDAMDYLADYLEEPEYINKIKEENEDLMTRIGEDYSESYNEKKKVFEWIDGLKKLNHIDIRKAYTQGHNCTEYQGYLGKITDFRKTDKIVGLGIYQIKNINFNGCDAIKKMKCLHENQAYPSPELNFYKKLGITFDIIMGCWGSSFDFKFPKNMYEKKGGVPYYSKWYGCLMKITDKDRYNFNCKDIDFAKLNAYCSDSSIRYNYEEDGGIIEYDRKHSFHSYHIASFISSYARITLLEQVLRFSDFNQIVSIVVDGIYYKGGVEVGELFSDKEQKSLKHNIDSYEYVPECGYDIDCKGDFRENNIHEVHLGAGGCGKTHNNLTDPGLVNPLFVAPSWKLARNKKSEYSIDSTTFFHTLDDDPDKWRPLSKNYSVFIIDEISMLSNEGKEKILKRFPNHKIIFCGDVGFQLPPIEGSEFKSGKIPVFHHTTNYRCKCKKLEKRLLWIRERIKGGIDNTNISQAVKIMGMDIISSDNIDYSVQDLILCATHEKKDKYTEKYKNLEKYSVKENTRDYCNGEIIIGPKPKKVSCELRHAFTIHSIQGETASHKLYIEMKKMRSLKMLYTAMSRARTLDQIVFIQ
jgi:hypothetical protein